VSTIEIESVGQATMQLKQEKHSYSCFMTGTSSSPSSQALNGQFRRHCPQLSQVSGSATILPWWTPVGRSMGFISSQSGASAAAAAVCAVPSWTVHTVLPCMSRSRPSMDRTSLVPSSIIDALASRKIFSIGYSLESPKPPKICIAWLATRKAVSVDSTLAAIA
jgi:hypothetical protein